MKFGLEIVHLKNAGIWCASAHAVSRRFSVFARIVTLLLFFFILLQKTKRVVNLLVKNLGKNGFETLRPAKKSIFYHSFFLGVMSRQLY